MRVLIRAFGPALLFIGNAFGQGSTIVLQRTWVEEFKDRATISGKFIVDHAHHKANPPEKDADIHVAGRSRQVGLPMVAEVMNAAEKQEVIDDVIAREDDHQPVDFTGAWRLWFEHPPSGETQVQQLDEDIAPGKNTNPPHCFEVHPLTAFDKIDLKETFHPIDGFEPKDATDAFGRYEKLRLTLSSDSDTVSLTSKMIGFNYVKFRLSLDSEATDLPGGDGLEANVDVFAVEEGDQEPLASNIRVIFVAGTEPARQVTKLSKGDEMVVLGIPRLNLNAVSTFLNAGGTSAAERKLQYEMIIVAVEGSDGSSGGENSGRSKKAKSRSKSSKKGRR